MGHPAIHLDHNFDPPGGPHYEAEDGPEDGGSLSFTIPRPLMGRRGRWAVRPKFASTKFKGLGESLLGVGPRKNTLKNNI